MRASFLRLARGRVLVIDYFASRRCSAVIGDLTASFEDAPPGPGYAELASIDGIRVFSETRLLVILGDAGPGLKLGGPLFARHLAVDLTRPERWIDFLESAGVLASRRRADGATVVAGQGS